MECVTFLLGGNFLFYGQAVYDRYKDGTTSTPIMLPHLDVHVKYAMATEAAS